MIRAMIRVLFALCPVRKNRIFFSSYEGKKIDCNPRCIYNYLLENAPGKYEYIWVLNAGKPAEPVTGTKYVKRFSLKWFYYVATSKIIVDNLPSSLLMPKRKSQFFVQTWHAGGAYKNVGAASAKTCLDNWAAMTRGKVIDLFVSSSTTFTKSNIEKGYQYFGEVLNCGMPRNDLFFNKNKVAEAKEKVKTALGCKEDMLVLYAPTYRGNLKHSERINNGFLAKEVMEVVIKRMGQKVTILIREHHYDNNKYNYGDSIIDVSSYPDMQELLCAADFLITDYSSSMWDFSLLGKPCFLYVSDLEDYKKEDRGFLTPIEQWPGIICKNMDELCKNILEFDEDRCAEKARQYLKEMGSYETGSATQKVGNRIMSYMQGK